MNLYAQELVDHFKNPRNKGFIDNATIITDEFNPSCGDKVKFYILVQDDKAIKFMFEGFGCVISQATASMLTENLLNKSLKEILDLDSTYVTNLINLDLGPTRLKCATISLDAIQKGIDYFLKG